MHEPLFVPKNFSRRGAIRISAGTLLALGLWPGRLRAADNGKGGEFTFIAVNDLHYLNEKCEPFFAQMVKQMKATEPKAEFALVVGDVCEHGKPEQLGPIRAVLDSLAMPYSVVVGNHDYITPTDRKPWEQRFPDSLNYHFAHRGWQFIALDSSEGQKAGKVTVQPHTLRFLDDTLPKLKKEVPTVVFTHFPFGPLTPSRPLNADAVLERFKEFNLVAVYNGHFHGFTERTLGKTVLTTNKCCSFSRANHDKTPEKGYFVCTAKEGRIERRFVEVKLA